MNDIYVDYTYEGAGDGTVGRPYGRADKWAVCEESDEWRVIERSCPRCFGPMGQTISRVPYPSDPWFMCGECGITARGIDFWEIAHSEAWRNARELRERIAAILRSI